jgi:hypothetical protein
MRFIFNAKTQRRKGAQEQTPVPHCGFFFPAIIETHYFPLRLSTFALLR